MQFQHPSFLWALSVLAIPIIIHLFNLRRYKTVFFSDISFLKEVKQSTKKQRKLKEWLVLFTRLLALAAIVLAFAKPFFPVADGQKNTSKTIIVLDNSPSTTLGNGEVNPFERAKELAINLVNQLPENESIALVTTNSSSLNFTSKLIVLEELKTLSSTDRIVNTALFQEQENTSIYFITDLQKNSLPFLNQKNASSDWVVIPTIKDDEVDFTNVFIDSVWTEAPFLIAGQPVELSIRLRSIGLRQTDANVEITVNGLPEITLSALLSAGSDTVIKTTLTQLKGGYNSVLLNLSNDEVLFDNRYSLSYFLPISNSIVEVYKNEPSNLIRKIFTGDEFVFQSMQADNVNIELLEQADLIIINQLEEISSGLTSVLKTNHEKSNLFVIPSAEKATGINAFLTELGAKNYGALDTSKLQTQSINTTDPFFEEVFAGSVQNAYWPSISKHFKLARESKLPSFNLMTLANGDPLFVRITNGSSNIYQLAVPLDQSFSDISTHPVIVPLFIKALVKKDNISSLTGIVGEDARFDISSASKLQESPLTLRGNNQEMIPQQQTRGSVTSILVGAKIFRNGTYYLYREENNVANISYNISTVESNIQRFTSTELNNIIAAKDIKNVHVIEATAATIRTMLDEWQQGIQLWKYCLFLALLFVLLEVILLRFLK